MGALYHHASGSNLLDHDFPSVADFTSDSGSWKEDVLRSVLLSDAAEFVLNIPPPAALDPDDSISWSLTTDGPFSLASAYNYLSSTPSCPIGRVYNRLWKWKGPERLRLLIWRILANSLLTNLARVRRNLDTNAFYPVCHNQVESNIHALRDCSTAKFIWTQVSRNDLFPYFFSSNLHDWIFVNLSWTGLNNGRTDWPITFVVTLDVLWRHMNELIFSQKSYSDNESIQEILHRSTFVAIALKIKRVTSVKDSSPRPSAIGWYPPQEGWLKINCDGSVLAHQNLAACGGIVRNWRGAPICCYMAKLGSVSILFAKLWAILHGLKVAMLKSQHFVVIESDSKSAINLIINGVARQTPCSLLDQ
ncbi:Ribonuclease H-like superfamily [Sesbania bispinosa]|nr:Ribonuclease H-like superfamily [Sesbania bispinosa]